MLIPFKQDLVTDLNKINDVSCPICESTVKWVFDNFVSSSFPEWHGVCYCSEKFYTARIHKVKIELETLFSEEEE